MRKQYAHEQIFYIALANKIDTRGKIWLVFTIFKFWKIASCGNSLQTNDLICFCVLFDLEKGAILGTKASLCFIFWY